MYDHIKTKYQSNSKLCYMDTDSFVIYIKTENFYEDIDNDVENMFDTSNYSPNINRPLSIHRNKKVLGKMKDELGGIPVKEFVQLRPKTYSYTVHDGNSDNKAKRTKKCVIKQRLKFNDYKECLQNNKTILKSEQRFKSEAHNIYTEEVNKIALNSNDDKRLLAYDGVKHILMDKSARKVLKIEMLSKYK